MLETANKGYVVQIIGPVLDIEFPDGNLPPIYSAMTLKLMMVQTLLKYNNY